MEDPTDPGWHVVLNNKPRDTYDMGGDTEELLANEPYGRQHHVADDQNGVLTLVRTNVMGTTIDSIPRMVSAQASTSTGLINDEDENFNEEKDQDGNIDGSDDEDEYEDEDADIHEMKMKIQILTLKCYFLFDLVSSGICFVSII